MNSTNEKNEERKLPYNLRPPKNTNAEYRNMIRPELADELFKIIRREIIVKKKYRDKTYSAKQLAEEAGTNPRYISAVINSRFGMNYSRLVNQCRIKDALKILSDSKYEECTIEDIGEMVGFANRQSFYASFYNILKTTPREFRKEQMAVSEAGTARDI